MNDWPIAIAHVDGDSFFASCIQSVYPQFRDKPLVVGRERGVATAVSYEAKNLGVKREMLACDIKRNFPQVIIFDSDYHLYEAISRKMVAISRRFSPLVEVFSVDEVFIDLSMYLDRQEHLQIAKAIQYEIESSLMIPVSIGVSVNKTLAKMASSANKPHGYTIVSKKDIEPFLKEQPIDAICGVGRALNNKFLQYGISTAYDLYKKPLSMVKLLYNKNIQKLYFELHGEYRQPVNCDLKDSYQSISTFRTFPSPTTDKEYILSRFIHNLNLACFKAYRYKQAPRKVLCFLRLQTMRHIHFEVRLRSATNLSGDIFKQVRKLLEKLIDSSKLYRQVGVVLTDFVDDSCIQQYLFEEHGERSNDLKNSIFSIKEKYGVKSIYWGEEHEFALFQLPTHTKTRVNDLFVAGSVC